MASLVPPADSLWSFLWGKRHARRHPVALVAEVRGLTGSFAARARDLSSRGTLLEFAEEDVRGCAGSPGTTITEALQRLLGAGFRIRFPGKRIAVDAAVVRVAWKPDAPGWLCVGCSFGRELNPLELRRLGLHPEACGPESGAQARPSSRMAWQARPESGLTVAVAVDGETGWTGPFVAADGKAIATTLRDADPTEIVARLSRHQLSSNVRLGAQALWATAAWLLAVRLPEGGAPGGIEVVLLAQSPLPAPVREHLVPLRPVRAGAAARR